MKFNDTFKSILEDKYESDDKISSFEKRMNDLFQSIQCHHGWKADKNHPIPTTWDADRHFYLMIWRGGGVVISGSVSAYNSYTVYRIELKARDATDRVRQTAIVSDGEANFKMKLTELLSLPPEQVSKMLETK